MKTMGNDKTQEVSGSAGAPRITAIFSIAGRDFDTDECTSAIGLEPSEIWRQKIPELRQRMDLPNVNWSIRRESKTLYSVSDVVDQVIDAVWSHRDRIEDYVRGKPLEVVITCTVTMFHDRPVLDLSAATIRRMADMKCGFTLDVIDYSD